MGVETKLNEFNYTGEWKNGQFHGVVECTWNDARTYRGQWVDGKRSGWGENRLADGRYYLGEFLNDQKHGYGLLKSKNSEYRGFWK